MAKHKENVKSTYASAFHVLSIFPSIQPIPVPRAIAPTIEQIEETDTSSKEWATEKIIPLVTLKEITPVASLNNDSPSMIVSVVWNRKFFEYDTYSYRISGCQNSPN